jgi:two-component system chemotaxis response regulator CheB
MGAFPLPEYVDIFLLGASAGGVEALLVLLPALRRAGRSSGFVAMHRLRDQGSMLLPSILGRSCAAALVEAEDKLPIQNGMVYLAPADYHLLVDPGPAIALSADEPVHYSRPSIDVMFESAAHVYRERVLGVILTGANADGAAGLQAVRKAGGVTVVQDPATAFCAVMPAAAVDAGPVDAILGLDAIRELLATLP